MDPLDRSQRVGESLPLRYLSKWKALNGRARTTPTPICEISADTSICAGGTAIASVIFTWEKPQGSALRDPRARARRRRRGRRRDRELQDPARRAKKGTGNLKIAVWCVTIAVLAGCRKPVPKPPEPQGYLGGNYTETENQSDSVTCWYDDNNGERHTWTEQGRTCHALPEQRRKVFPKTSHSGPASTQTPNSPAVTGDNNVIIYDGEGKKKP
jgi:hypothetical protein